MKTLPTISSQKPNRRKRVAARKKRTLAAAFLVTVIFLFGLGWAVFSWLQSLIGDALVNLAETKRGELVDSLPVQVLIVREEEILFMPVTGKLTSRLGEGERVRVGTVIADVIPEGVSTTGEGGDYRVVSPVAGTLSYQFNPVSSAIPGKKVFDLSSDRIKVLFEQSQQPNKPLPEVINKGYAVARVVDSFQPVFLVAIVPSVSLPSQWVQGQQITFNLGEGGLQLKTWIAGLRQEGEETVLLAQADGGAESLGGSPVATLDLITRRYPGVIVPRRSLVFREGEFGVYSASPKGVNWEPVQLVGLLGNQAAVKGIQPGIEIMAKP